MDLIFQARNPGPVLRWSNLVLAQDHALKGAVKRAFEVFTELKFESPIDPNHAIMCFLIDACSKTGDGNSTVYTMMHKCGIRGSPEPYTTAVHACSSHFSIYNDMKKEHVKPDEIFFSALIDVAGHGGKFDCTFVLQEESLALESLQCYCFELDEIFHGQTGIFLYENIQVTANMRANDSFKIKRKEEERENHMLKITKSLDDESVLQKSKQTSFEAYFVCGTVRKMKLDLAVDHCSRLNNSKKVATKWLYNYHLQNVYEIEMELAVLGHIKHRHGMF
ncbi:hypothetical protein SELMODRAFT_431990 [Selaginella moellendorffii]|uniref:Pentacotripeptide-repeat region of PRORP domain-containing protein n=1 Tax=Selaginella moellendorffii TaxID=88036 RepID=D8TEM1_SELML|nr:hypothetical protein SELMODRAFT_431990 [Selaginella moellendorffii]